MSFIYHFSARCERKHVHIIRGGETEEQMLMLRRCQHHYDIIEAKRFPACPHLTCFF